MIIGEEKSKRPLTKIEETLRMLPTVFGPDGQLLIDAIKLFQKVMPHVKALPTIKDATGKTDAIEEITDLFENEAIQGILGGTIKLPTTLSTKDMNKQFDKLTAFTIGANKVARAVTNRTIGKGGTAAAILEAKAAVVAIGELLTVSEGPKEVKKAFKDGKLRIVHEFPQGIAANVDVHVHLNKDNLAKSLHNNAKFYKGSVRSKLGAVPAASS